MTNLERIIKYFNQYGDCEFEIRTKRVYKTYRNIEKIEGTKVTCWNIAKTARGLDNKVVIDLSKYDDNRVMVF